MHRSRFALPVPAPLVLLLTLTLLLPALPTLPVSAATRTVTAIPDDGTTGTLRQVIASALPNDTIVFQPGLTGTIVLDTIRGPLVLAQNVTITGPGAASIVISGNNAVRVFTVSSGVTATISGVSVTRGIANGSDGYGGGGILNLGTLALTNCTISTNRAGGGGVGQPGFGGGGIANMGTLTVMGSTITGNSAGPGGDGSGSTVAGPGGNGGGIFTQGGTLTVTGNSTIRNNIAGPGGYGGTSTHGGAGGSGGGIYSVDTTTVTGSTVSGNTTGAGGDSNASGTGAGVVTAAASMPGPP